jgi:membrane fusion protein (multidrug efflux system)
MNPVNHPQPGPPPGSRARVVVLRMVVVLLALLFIAGYLIQLRAKQESANAAAARPPALPRVTVVQPRSASNLRTVELPGNLQPLESTAVYARATGYVRRWLVDIGDRVSQGQLLAEVDTPDLDQQLEQARASLGQMRASLEQAAANARYASSTESRYALLVARHFVSQQDYEQTEAQASVGVANVHAAQSAIAAQKANVHQLEQLKAFARVLAPFTGTITERHIDRGTLVAPGSLSGKPLYRIAISNPLDVFVRVPQALATNIVIGSTVTLRVRQHPDRRYQGRVIRTSEAIDPQTRTLNVEARVSNDDGDLFPGAYAQVTLSTALGHGVTVLPATAVLLDTLGARVATIDSHSRVHLVPVQLGRDLGQEIELTGGLTGNERVVEQPAADITEGERVEVSPGAGTTQGGA